MRHVDDHAPGTGDVRITDDLLDVVDRRAGNAEVHQVGDDILCRPLRCPFRDDILQRGVFPDPVPVGLEPRVGQQLFMANGLAEALPDFLPAHADDDPTVGRREGVVGGDELVAVSDAAGNAPLDEIELNDGLHGAYDGIHQGHIDPLAPARPLPALQGRQNTDGAVQAR